MKPCLLARVSDHELLKSFETLVRQDRSHTGDLVAHIAEIDGRRLYLPAGCPSMFEYCVRVWHMSEDMAYKRIRAARAARRFPVLLDALADGRLHLAGVVLLAPCLTRHNVDELVTAATHRSKAEIEHLLAQRFPRPDVPTVLRAVATPCPQSSSPVAQTIALEPGAALAQVAPSNTADAREWMGLLAPGPVVPSLAHDLREDMRPVGAPVTPGAETPPVVLAPAAPHARVAPLSPGRYALQVTVDQATYELLQQAKALLGHSLPAGDTAQVLKRALDVLVTQLERSKFAETDAPRPRRSHAIGRYIPAEIKRAVWKRDGGRCTFVGHGGRRCGCRSRLEFDQIIPVSRGGRSTEDNLRLRCQAHNQYEAERMFGAGFMREKRGARHASRTAGTHAADATNYGSP